MQFITWIENLNAEVQSVMHYLMVVREMLTPKKMCTLLHKLL